MNQLNKCVVCGEANHEMVCQACGFDKSCDYEAFPTLGKLPQGISSTQVKKATYDSGRNNRLCCKKCGRTTFEFLVDKAILRCTNCGIGVSLGRVNAMVQQCSNKAGYLVPGNPRHYLSAGSNHTVILRRDGTVRVAGAGKYQEAVQCWRDIICVAAGNDFTAALKKDGTVCVAGNLYHLGEVSRWKEIAYICAAGSNLIGLRKDGTAVSTHHDLREWKNISQVAAGLDMSFGLLEDGTIVCDGPTGFWNCDFKKWHDIVAISAGYHHIVGLKKDGTVVSSGYNVYGQCDVTTWKNIIALSAGPHVTLGLTKDGTVLATMGNHNTANWKDIIAISAGSNHVVGLDRNGTFWAAGENTAGQCDINKLTC